MTDKYAELIERLKTQFPYVQMIPAPAGELGFYSPLQREAADAIRELRERVAEIEEENEAWENGTQAIALKSVFEQERDWRFRLEAERDQLRAENAALAKDAARYRWLRVNRWYIPLLDTSAINEWHGDRKPSGAIDAAIDKAMEDA